MEIYKPEESNPLLMPELVSVVLATLAAATLIAALLGFIRWMA